LEANLRIDIERHVPRAGLLKWQRVKLQPQSGQQGGWLFWIGDGEQALRYPGEILANTIENVARQNKYLLVYPTADAKEVANHKPQ
jgi:hypothetical protein